MFADIHMQSDAREGVRHHATATQQIPCCVEKDAAPDSIDRTVKLDCASVVVASFWGNATARAWLEGNCHVDTPTACETCCVDNNKDYGGTCNCAACVDEVNLRTRATAEVLASTKIENNTASCTYSVSSVIDGVQQEIESKVVQAVRHCLVFVCACCCVL